MKTKKGFTLVELLVVIAILAILATVSIVGYTSFIKKANYSNDEALVTQWNTLLNGKDILNETPNNINEVKDFFKENGSEDKDFLPQSDGYYFYWNETDNKIYLKKSTYDVEKPYYRLDLTWYKVTFDYKNDDYTGENKIIYVASGEKIEDPHDSTTITTSNNTFMSIKGWYYINANEEDVNWDFDNTIESDLTLYAYWACFVAGTKITMADGSYKNIEDIKEGELVLTFSHEKGIYEAQKVYLAWCSEYKATAFTLHFANGSTLSIVGEHDIFEEESLHYVTILESNAEQYIGKHFYNVTDNKYVELIDVTYETEAVDFYSLSVEYNANCIANGMLSVPVETEDILNIYKFNKDLTIDHVQLEEDIANYGLFEYPSDASYPKEYYDAFQMRYINIMVGKGLVSWETILSRIADGLDVEN